MECNSSGDTLGTGIIRYAPENGWDAEVHFVEFLHHQLLRCTGNEQGDEEDSKHGREKKETKPSLSWRYCASKGTQPNCSTASDDDDWRVVSRATLEGKKRKVIASKSIFCEDLQQIRERYAHMKYEIEDLRETVEKLENAVRRLETPLSNDAERNGSRIISRMKTRLVLRLQSSLRDLKTTSTKANGSSSTTMCTRRGVTLATNIDAIYCNSIRIQADCDLDHFESVARNIYRVLTPGRTVFFYPEFEYTQSPSLASVEFSLMFSSFAALCKVLGIGSLSDRLELMRKCGTASGRPLLRLIGTYAYDPTDASSPSYINIGSSGVYCESLQTNKSDASNVTNSRQVKSCEHRKTEEVTMVYRPSRKWNYEHQRFQVPPKLIQGKACIGYATSDSNSESMHQIQLLWRRASGVASRLWSKEMSSGTSVHGTLEILLPYVQVACSALCRELAGVLPDGELERVLI